MFDLFSFFGRKKGLRDAALADDAEALIESWMRHYLRRWWSRHVKAHERESLRTLLRCLSETQRKELLSRNAFSVNGYTIECSSTASNILRNAPYCTRLCAVPIAAHGYFDVFLVQKLWIEHSERDFLSVAVSRPARN